MTAQTLWPRPDQRPASVVPAAQAVEPAADTTADAASAADRALRVATDHLQRGERTAAQRQIEILVARYPDTAAAARARQLLLGLYAGTQPRAPVDAARPAAAGTAPATPDTPKSAGPPPASPAALQPKPALSANVIRNLQDDLRLAAGDRVFFADGTTDLTAGARMVLDLQARWLLRHPTLVLQIEGHGDERGGAASSMRLSQERAAAVRAWLISAGVGPDRITVQAFGDRNRAALCTEAVCLSQNRRVVVALGGGVGSTARPGTDADRRQPGVVDGAAPVPPR